MDQQVLEHYSKAGVEEGPLNDFLSSTSVPSFRYVRLNPRMNTNETLASLPKPSPVPWLPSSTNFYAIPNRTINTLDPYVDGSLYGMDCSSGAAVAALRLETVNKPVRVLDLCCCPCAKLCMIVDSLEHLSGCEVVGVDISGNRLNVGKKIARKYLKGAACEVRLYQADGTTFPGPADDISASPSLVFDSRAEAQETNQGERKKMNKSAKSREVRVGWRPVFGPTVPPCRLCPPPVAAFPPPPPPSPSTNAPFSTARFAYRCRRSASPSSCPPHLLPPTINSTLS